MSSISPLSPIHQYLLGLASLLIVGFGQPIWNGAIGMLASVGGFALFWRILLDISSKKSRFFLAMGWFSAVQLIQLFWLVYHPYAYIYAVYGLFALFLGAQFGLLGILITPFFFKKWIPLLGIAAVWTLMEWSRLFYFSGYSWNPVGLSLAGDSYALQAASLVGVFGLSFWVIFVNALGLRAWLLWPSPFSTTAYLVAALLPTLYGVAQLKQHAPKMAEAPTFTTLLVQTAFPAEEALDFKEVKHYVAFVLDEWRDILKITKKYVDEKIDLIALPEYVVPFGTYSFIYPYDIVSSAFQEAFGAEVIDKLPPKESPYAKEFETTGGHTWAVNNAFWAQGIANIFDAPLIAGLEDAEDIDETRHHYSSALYFTPFNLAEQHPRYAKRVLVPMAEYIPFAFCRQLASQYGINGSFVCGKEAQLYTTKDTRFGTSICYEETFGHLMRENKQKGADLLVNLTSDVWFPHSLLPHQHLEHARLRTVECGLPLVRACNTGITSAIDSTGHTVALLGETPFEQEWSSDSLLATVPLYAYETLYTSYGDRLIVGICLSILLLWAGFYLLKIDDLL